MSAADRDCERALADLYDEAIRPPDEVKGPLYPRAKTFANGYALATVWRMLTG